MKLSIQHKKGPAHVLAFCHEQHRIQQTDLMHGGAAFYELRFSYLPFKPTAMLCFDSPATCFCTLCAHGSRLAINLHLRLQTVTFNNACSQGADENPPASAVSSYACSTHRAPPETTHLLRATRFFFRGTPRCLRSSALRAAGCWGARAASYVHGPSQSARRVRQCLPIMAQWRTCKLTPRAPPRGGTLNGLCTKRAGARDWRACAVVNVCRFALMFVCLLASDVAC